MQQLQRRIKKVRSVFAQRPCHVRHIVTMLSSITEIILLFFWFLNRNTIKFFIKIVTFSHFFLVVLLFISDIPYIPPVPAQFIGVFHALFGRRIDAFEFVWDS